MRRDDWLIHQLPVAMTEDDFLVRFLSIFQTVSDTVLHQVDTLPHAFDPSVAPLPMVRAMGAWMGLGSVDSSLDEDIQRQVVRRYSDLLGWRGTRQGLELLLEVISGEPAIVEDSGGVYAEGEAPRATPHVSARVRSTGWMETADLVEILKSEMPASVTFDLFVADTQVWPDPDPVWAVDRFQSVDGSSQEMH